jgi:hypothetical protein
MLKFAATPNGETGDVHDQWAADGNPMDIVVDGEGRASRVYPKLGVASTFPEGGAA